MSAMRRSKVSSRLPFAVGTLGAIAMALAFPKTNGTIGAPLGAAALFWSWYALSPARAFWAGWLAGIVFFLINFSWFGETAGAVIAPFGFIVTAGPALGDGFFGFALPAVLIAMLARTLESRDRVSRALVPLGAAAVFAFAEWFRSEGIGVLGVPFGSLGLTQTHGVLAPLAAFVGTYGITFVLCTVGAYVAYAIRMRKVRGAGMDASLAALAIVVLVAVAWMLWPGRTFASPTIPVAAIQGNIAQSLKFKPGSAQRAIERYTELTKRAVRTHPTIIVWPETVIPVALNREPALRAGFATLARTSKAELVVGTNEYSTAGAFNVLYFFTPDGGLDSIYRKRQLVPFAEDLPFAPLFSWIPLTQEISHFSSGSSTGIISAHGLRVGPIICWESAFSGMAVDDVAQGADALIVSTDDAWFGTTAGPYQHAQISQMRAIETGRWVIRAASTGISGIIAPDGRYERAAELGEAAVVTGLIGVPVATIYDAIGPRGIAMLLAAIVFCTALTARLRKP